MPTGSENTLSDGSHRPVWWTHIASRLGAPRSLRSYLVLFAAALWLPLLLLAGVSLNRMATLEREQLELRIQSVSRDLTRMIDRELDHAISTLQTLASSRGLATENLGVFLDRAQKALPNARSTIFLLDRDFKPIMNARVTEGTPLPAIADLETPKAVIMSLTPQVSGVVTEDLTKRPVVHVEVPVIMESEVRYILGMAIETSFFANVLRANAPDAIWVVGITDLNGLIVARSERHQEFSGKPLPGELFHQSRQATGAFRGVSAAGEAILRVTSRSRNAGWLVSATVPQWYADAAQRQWHLWLFILALAGLVCGGILAYFFAALIQQPLAQATAAAKDLGSGAVLEARTSPLSEANALNSALSAASKELATRAAHAALLTREVTHRSKNLLAVVISLTNQIARQSGSVEEFRERLAERLHALGRSKDLLIAGEWKGADLAELVRTQLRPFVDPGSSRLTLDGPPLFLHADAVRNLGLALHELATNAAKYGALTVDEGTIAVQWRLRGGERGTVLELSWAELAGCRARSTRHDGFGSLVLRVLVPRAVDGSAALEFTETGVRWSLRAPLRLMMGS
jgi:two-component sensor histidine kinase